MYSGHREGESGDRPEVRGSGDDGLTKRKGGEDYDHSGDEGPPSKKAVSELT